MSAWQVTPIARSRCGYLYPKTTVRCIRPAGHTGDHALFALDCTRAGLTPPAPPPLPPPAPVPPPPVVT